MLSQHCLRINYQNQQTVSVWNEKINEAFIQIHQKIDGHENSFISIYSFLSQINMTNLIF